MADSAALTIYGDSGSGNCLKIRYVADHLSIPYRWIETSVLAAATRTKEFLALNPAGQVPLAILPDGRPLAQSAAIMLHLAEGSALIPADPYERALMFQFLFWEQYSHETAIAVRRFQKHYLGKPDDEIDRALLRKGRAALALMESHLKSHDFFPADTLTLADVALVAYTRLAPEGGFDLTPYAATRAWISRVEAALRIA
jgi:glutathione S-transferase